MRIASPAEQSPVESNGATCLLPQQPQNSLARRKKRTGVKHILDIWWLCWPSSLIILLTLNYHFCLLLEIPTRWKFSGWGTLNTKSDLPSQNSSIFFSSTAMEFHELLTRQITKFWRINKAVCWICWRKKQRANVPPLTTSQSALFALKGLSLSCWNVVLTHHCVISIWCHH